jgi:hypothetical protein
MPYCLANDLPVFILKYPPTPNVALGGFLWKTWGEGEEGGQMLKAIARQARLSGNFSQTSIFRNWKND